MNPRRLDRGGIASPCPVSWSSMSGTDVTRTCATCARQVHDLSSMTTAEAEALLFSKSERICVRFARDADGAILTADRLVKIRKGPYAGLSAAALAAAVALSQPACATPTNQPTVSEREQAATDRAPVTAGPVNDSARGTKHLPSGTLSGRVHGYANYGIDGARVVVISESTGDEHAMQTQADGEFRLELPVGSYTISVTDGEGFFRQARVESLSARDARPQSISSFFCSHR